MADNLSPSAAVFSALPDHAVIELDGPDSSAFAHAQFANDVVALASGKWQWNAWLTPKGRVIALFALLKLSDTRLLLLLPDAPAQALAEQLRRFVFRRKSKIEVRANLQVSGSFSPPAQAHGPDLSIDGDVVEMDLGGEAGPRTLRISQHSAANDPQAQARWHAFDLCHGLPRLPASQREQWTPQQLSLERLPAFSVKKGCYPGQEIVARTHFLGQAKRALVLLQADTPLHEDTDVEAAGKTQGRIVAVTGIAPWQALAVLPLERDDTQAMSASGIALHVVPLQEGLRR